MTCRPGYSGFGFLVILATACSSDSDSTTGPPQPHFRAPPTVSAVSPTSVVAGSPDLTLAITGTHFADALHYRSQAVWAADGRHTRLSTTFVDSTKLTALIPAALLSNPVAALVFVETRDPMSDGPPWTSNTVGFAVTSTALPPDGPVAEIVLFAPPASIGVGEVGLLHAWADGANIGRIRPLSPIKFTSSNETIATVVPLDAGGYPGVDFSATLSGIAKGTVTITAAADGKARSIEITVGAPATSMTLFPTTATISATRCEAVQLTAVLRDAVGTQLNGRRPVWSSNSPSAYVEPITGRVFAGDSGTATITANTGLITANVAIAVVGHQPGRRGCDG